MEFVRGSASRLAAEPAGQGQLAGQLRPYALLLTENKGLLSKIGQPFLTAGCDLVMSKTSHEASRYISRLRPRYVVVEIEHLRSESHRFLKSVPEREARAFELIVIIRHPLLRALAESAHADHILTSRERSPFLPAQIRRLCLSGA